MKADKANGWTPERRAKQAEAIRAWRPWEKSTGPTTLEGKATASRNAFKGGHRAELRELVRLVNEHVREARELMRRL
ncbi:hypothetical protein [Azohydromonas aeria]|uniref:hypothetical protein n=1 Tax=Azohydromonas aeria TaxID=2590212 RepID=UPI0012F7C3C7|nr:hypothetical protein [Azohydromonas aeria]